MQSDQLYLRQIARDWEQSATGGYLFALPVVRHLDKITFQSPVTFFVGENGTGKSTLLEAMAVACGYNAEGGGRNFQFSTHRSHSELHRYLRLVRGPRRPRDGFFLRAESFYNVASYLDELDTIPAAGPSLRDAYGGQSLHEQSHGESFLALMLNRFSGQGLYFLDEPEAALSPSSQFTMLARMGQLVRQQSQLIIATHSPILMAYPGAELYVLSQRGIERTSYEQTEHYQLTKRFLDDPRRMLRLILEE